MGDINKKELETNGIKLGEIDFKNYLNTYAGTRTFYLYNGRIYVSVHHTNGLCYTGNDSVDIFMDERDVKDIVNTVMYEDRMEDALGINEEIYDNLKESFNK